MSVVLYNNIAFVFGFTIISCMHHIVVEISFTLDLIIMFLELYISDISKKYFVYIKSHV